MHYSVRYKKTREFSSQFALPQQTVPGELFDYLHLEAG